MDNTLKSLSNDRLEKAQQLNNAMILQKYYMKQAIIKVLQIEIIIVFFML